MAVYFKTISESEAYYSLREGKIIQSGGGQSSYNLPKYFFKYATEKNILIPDSNFPHARKGIDGNAFVLNELFSFRLGKNVLSLIGEGYSSVDNKFVASMNGTNGKFQIYRKVYDELGWRYGWFVDLYDRNLSGNELVLYIDEQNKIFTIDIEFSEVDKNTYLEYINKPENAIR